MGQKGVVWMPSTSKEPLSVENLKENPTDTGNDAGKDVTITNKVFILH